MISIAFGIGGAISSSVEFFHYDKSSNIYFNRIRTVVCCLLTLILVLLWVLTFAKTIYTFRRKPSDELPPGKDPNERVSRVDNIMMTGPAVVSQGEILELKEQRQKLDDLDNNQQPPPHQLKQQKQQRQKQQHKKSSSASTAILSETKLVPVFVAMLVLFFVGYFPILAFFIDLYASEGSFTTQTDPVVDVLWATGSTGLAVASFLNPLLVLWRVDHLKIDLCCWRTSSQPGNWAR